VILTLRNNYDIVHHGVDLSAPLDGDPQPRFFRIEATITSFVAVAPTTRRQERLLRRLRRVERTLVRAGLTVDRLARLSIVTRAGRRPWTTGNPAWFEVTEADE